MSEENVWASKNALSKVNLWMKIKYKKNVRNKLRFVSVKWVNKKNIQILWGQFNQNDEAAVVLLKHLQRSKIKNNEIKALRPYCTAH